ncbi:hypothetical protein G5I_10095 [Acromyrmex echinatior]|uniref:Uncharacterized protein n=1 Tax=Acromyrmex echinatior TaxID=103372 RepID=F4WW61_ACREC|nr:hypothetical protein G5I_10095 [Acromyrmex echinatior]
MAINCSQEFTIDRRARTIKSNNFRGPEETETAKTPGNNAMQRATNNQSIRAIIGANIYPTDKEQIDIREPGLLYSLSSVDVQYTTPVRVG